MLLKNKTLLRQQPKTNKIITVSFILSFSHSFACSLCVLDLSEQCFVVDLAANTHAKAVHNAIKRSHSLGICFSLQQHTRGHPPSCHGCLKPCKSAREQGNNCGSLGTHARLMDVDEAVKDVEQANDVACCEADELPDVIVRICLVVTAGSHPGSACAHRVLSCTTHLWRTHSKVAC